MSESILLISANSKKRHGAIVINIKKLEIWVFPCYMHGGYSDKMMPLNFKCISNDTNMQQHNFH
jgi:hypothetical protein